MNKGEQGKKYKLKRIDNYTVGYYDGDILVYEYHKNSDGNELWYEYDKDGNEIHFKSSEGDERWSDDNPDNPEYQEPEYQEPFTFKD